MRVCTKKHVSNQSSGCKFRTYSNSEPWSQTYPTRREEMHQKKKEKWYLGCDLTAKPTTTQQSYLLIGVYNTAYGSVYHTLQGIILHCPFFSRKLAWFKPVTVFCFRCLSADVKLGLGNLGLPTGVHRYVCLSVCFSPIISKTFCY